jgi:hypothetical protein
MLTWMPACMTTPSHCFVARESEAKPVGRSKVLQRKATSMNSSLGIGTEDEEQVDLDVVEKTFLSSPFPFGLDERQGWS